MTAVLEPTPLQPSIDAAQEWRRRRNATLRASLSPPPRLTVSQWADEHRQLSPESCAEPGQWSTDRAPYLREIMDCLSDPSVEEVVFMKCARIGGTECGNNVVGYFVDQDPSPMLVIMPTVDMAKGWSKEQLAPMIRDTPRLRGKVRSASSRVSSNTIQQKTYPGGVLNILGANSGTGFRMRSVRVFYGSEVDAWPQSAGTEGDPVSLGKKRTETFPRRKIYLESTPLLKALSRIEPAYLAGDQRQFHVPCPDCGHEQVLRWKNLKYEELPEPMYACEACGVLIPEDQKYEMVRRGRWIAGAPFAGVASFRINALVSLFDGARWPKLVRLWREAQGDLMKLQVFINTVLGETWVDRTGAIDPQGLERRREAYAAEVPRLVALLTAGVDKQHDRLEIAIRGWGEGEESWLIRYDRLFGDPGHPAVWQALDELLLRDFRHASGEPLRVFVTCIDSGDNPDPVYRFCKARGARRVYATKGSSTPGAPLVPRRPSRNNKLRVPLFLIGTDAAKDVIYSRLKLVPPPEGAESGGPGYMHFCEGADTEYFKQLTVERAVPQQVNGAWRKRYVCPWGERNEALDCEVLALAALRLAPVQLDRLGAMAQQLVDRAAERTQVETQARPAEDPPDSETPPPPAPTNRVTGRRRDRRGPWWTWGRG